MTAFEGGSAGALLDEARAAAALGAEGAAARLLEALAGDWPRAARAADALVALGGGRHAPAVAERALREPDDTSEDFARPLARFRSSLPRPARDALALRLARRGAPSSLAAAAALAASAPVVARVLRRLVPRTRAFRREVAEALARDVDLCAAPPHRSIAAALPSARRPSTPASRRAERAARAHAGARAGRPADARAQGLAGVARALGRRAVPFLALQLLDGRNDDGHVGVLIGLLAELEGAP